LYRAAIGWKASIGFEPRGRDQNLAMKLEALGVMTMDTIKKTFVLVHGAWHGGWCYRHTAAALRKMGHEVFTPTHTGVGERAHKADENHYPRNPHSRRRGLHRGRGNQRHYSRRPFLWRHGHNGTGRPHGQSQRKVRISDVALQSGFSDVSYFNRLFRSRFGGTPSDVYAQSRRSRNLFLN
jgi:AraC-like DNA-binding protein